MEVLGQSTLFDRLLASMLTWEKGFIPSQGAITSRKLSPLRCAARRSHNAPDQVWSTV
jgi:hypothetical protein